VPEPKVQKVCGVWRRFIPDCIHSSWFGKECQLFVNLLPGVWTFDAPSGPATVTTEGPGNRPGLPSLFSVAPRLPLSERRCFLPQTSQTHGSGEGVCQAGCRRRPFCGDSSGTSHLQDCYSAIEAGKQIQAILSMLRERRCRLVCSRPCDPRRLPLPLAEGRANDGQPEKPRKDGVVDTLAQRSPSRPLKIRGNLVSPDRSV